MKKNIYIVGLMFLVLGFTSNLFAQDSNPVDLAEPAPDLRIIKSYRGYATVPQLKIPAISMVEVDFDLSEVFSDLVAVQNQETKQFVQYQVINTSDKNIKVSNSVDSVSSQSLTDLFDGNYSSVVDFNVDNSKSVNSANLQISFSEPIKSARISLSLSEYIRLPSTITVKALVNDVEVILLNKVSPTASQVTFQETIAKDWIVELTYSQPLRISELSFNNLLNTAGKKTVRFQGQPNNSYLIYVNPENSYRDDGNRLSNPSIATSSTVFKKLGKFQVVANPSFVLVDSDSDKVPDIGDNCVLVSNTNQEDLDVNGRGDVCDDSDSDSVINAQDNCVSLINSDQKDIDGDGVGDLCDIDQRKLIEKYPFLVWFGVGFGAMVLLGLLFLVINKIRKSNSIRPTPTRLDPPSTNLPPTINQ